MEARRQDASGGAYCCGEVADGEIGAGTGRRWGWRADSGGKGKVQHWRLRWRSPQQANGRDRTLGVAAVRQWQVVRNSALTGGTKDFIWFHSFSPGCTTALLGHVWFCFSGTRFSEKRDFLKSWCPENLLSEKSKCLTILIILNGFSVWPVKWHVWP
jgi:hypothetical protein